MELGKIVPAGSGADDAVLPAEDSGMISATRRARYLLAFMVFGLFGLAAFVPIEGAVIGPGQVSVDSRVKRLVHPTGGVLAELLVREGDRVEKGQLLMRLDESVLGPTARYAALNRNQLLAQRARLEAERDGRGAIIFPAELTSSRDADAAAAMDRERRQFSLAQGERSGTLALLRQRIRRYEEQINSYNAQIDATRRQLELIQPELEGLRSLMERGLVTINRLNQMERTAVQLTATEASLQANIAQAEAQISETQEQIVNVSQRSRVEAASNLAVVIAQLSEQASRAVSFSDSLERSQIAAPASGVVDNLFFTTIGSAIPAGEPVAEIVPDEDTLIVTAQIAPGDIDALKIGQEARVGFSTLDRQLSPEIEGTLVFIAPERTSDPDTGLSFYRVRVEVPNEDLKSETAGTGARVGLPVEVFFQTGSRSLLAWAIRPVADQLNRAMRE